MFNNVKKEKVQSNSSIGNLTGTPSFVSLKLSGKRAALCKPKAGMNTGFACLVKMSIYAGLRRLGLLSLSYHQSGLFS